MTKYTIIDSAGDELGRVEAANKAMAVNRFRQTYGSYGEFKGIRLRAVSSTQLKIMAERDRRARSRRGSNPSRGRKPTSVPKGKFISCKAVRINKNGSISIKK